MSIEEYQRHLASLLGDVFSNDAAAAVMFLMRPHPELQNKAPGCVVATVSGCREVERIIQKGAHGHPV